MYDVASRFQRILFVSRKAIPALRKIGVPERAIRTMTVDVPRRFFETKIA
jgi:predicted metal-dependent phosphotriesterase family hydrolase